MNFKYLTIILLALITGLTACNPQAQEETGAVKEDSIKVLPVKVITLEEVEESNELSYPSTIEAFEAVYLAPAQPGRVDRIFVEIGDHVKKGEVLAEMDKTQLRQAEIQLQQLKVDYDRMETLKKTNSISSQQYDQVKMQYDVALANIDFLRKTQILQLHLVELLPENILRMAKCTAVPQTHRQAKQLWLRWSR